MEYALSLARKSPPKPTNYRVGALLVDIPAGEMLSTGYTLELPGNTHAEQCCFMKLAEKCGVSEERLGGALVSATPYDSEKPRLALYTTMEPCSERLSGNLPCVQRVLRLTGLIEKVYVGVMEPKKFIDKNTGMDVLEAAGIKVIKVEGLEEEILRVATAGHSI